MLANERMNFICAMLKKNGAVTTAQIGKELNVSIETVRRDFLALEKENKLMRVHGGAVSPSENAERGSLPERLEMNRDGKRMLSKRACRFINEGDIISVDCGSTAVELAEVLADSFSRLTVVTHSLDVFERLQEKSGFKLIIAGGKYLREERAFYGSVTAEAYRLLHCDKTFIMPAAVSLKMGICNYSDKFMQLQRQMLDNADKAFVLADSEKLEKSALYKMSPLGPQFTLVTDLPLSGELSRLYRENGIPIADRD